MNAPTNTATDRSTYRFHESATAQVQGRASYIDDLPLVEGTLHAAPLMSPLANAQLIAMDLNAVLAAPGVVGTVTAHDIPGDPLLATFVHDEPIFAGPQLMHVGQVMGLVVGHSHTQARHAVAHSQHRFVFADELSFVLCR